MLGVITLYAVDVSSTNYHWYIVITALLKHGVINLFVKVISKALGVNEPIYVVCPVFTRNYLGRIQTGSFKK